MFYRYSFPSVQLYTLKDVFWNFLNNYYKMETSYTFFSEAPTRSRDPGAIEMIPKL